MKQQTFCQELKNLTPGVSEEFHQQVEDFLAKNLAQEACPKQPTRRKFRLGGRALVMALLALLLMGTVALAATHWGIFDTLGFMLGNQALSNSMQMEKILYQETVGNTEVSILEAGYDGRTLLLQYSCRNLDGTKTYGEWWTDHFWINGQSVDMPADSGADVAETDTPGEVVRTDYIRLDNESIHLSGQVTIGLPLGNKPDSAYFKSPYNSETCQYAQPSQGLVLFTFDTGDVLGRVKTIHPNVETVTDIVTAKASEVSFTPLMTYITLELVGNSDALAAYKAEHGEGYYDEKGDLVWEFTSMEVHTEYLHSLTLVDEAGRILFPGYYGNNGMGADRAEYLFPYIAEDIMLGHLYLAPTENGVIDMAEAIFIQ